MWRLTLGVALMSAVLGGAAVAGPLEDAEAAHARGDRATTLRLIREAASRDANGANFLLGKLFPACEPDIPNYAEIVTLIREAAEQGNPYAEFNLGNAYFFGRGVPKDDVQAAKWHRLAAEHGRSGAMQNFEYLYEKMTPTQRAEVQRLARESRPIGSMTAGERR